MPNKTTIELEGWNTSLYSEKFINHFAGISVSSIFVIVLKFANLIPANIGFKAFTNSSLLAFQVALLSLSMFITGREGAHLFCMNINLHSTKV